MTITQILMVMASMVPTQYTAAPIEAHVVEKETGRPLEGVLVIAHWNMEGENRRDVTLRVAETLTDRDGRFHFPGWGPVPRPKTGVLDREDPALIFFKPGYEGKALSNAAVPGERLGLTVRKSQWDRQRIPLGKRPADEEAYYLNLLSSLGRVQRLMTEPECFWKGIPLTVTMFDAEHFRERAAGINNPVTMSKQHVELTKCKGTP